MLVSRRHVPFLERALEESSQVSSVWRTDGAGEHAIPGHVNSVLWWAGWRLRAQARVEL